MKTIVIAVGVITSVILALNYQPVSSKIEKIFATEKYTQTSTATKVVEKEVEALDARIKAAQEAKMEALKTAAQAAYDAAMKQGLLEIELEETTKYRSEIERREQELQKQTGAY